MTARRRAWIATDTGPRRGGNEDRLVVSGWSWPGTDGAWTHVLDASRGFAAVADGMGGHQAGELASGTVVETLSAALPSADTEAAVDRALRQANDRVFEAMYAPEGRPGMGSTVAGVVLRGRHALIFNVGDSRVYLRREGGLSQLTIDDTPERGASVAGWRSHALTQSLGGSLSRSPITPHVRWLAMDPLDVLLICTDGLTDMLSDEEVVDLLARRVPNPAAALVAAAVEAGGRDNVTAVAVGPARA